MDAIRRKFFKWKSVYEYLLKNSGKAVTWYLIALTFWMVYIIGSGIANIIFWHNEIFTIINTVISGFGNLVCCIGTLILYFKLYLPNRLKLAKLYRKMRRNYEDMVETFGDRLDLSAPTDFSKDSRLFDVVYWIAIICNLFFALKNLYVWEVFKWMKNMV